MTALQERRLTSSDRESFRRDVRAELVKLRTDVVPCVAVAGGVVIILVLATLYALFAGEVQRPEGSGLALPEMLLNVYLTGFRYGFILSVLLGITMMAGDLRQGTLLTTLVASPRRSRVLAAKVAAAGVAGAVAGGLLLLAGLTVGVVAATIGGHPVLLTDPDTLGTIGAAWLAHPLFAVIGVGVGSLFRKELLAVIVALVWLLLVDGVVAGILNQTDALGTAASMLPGSVVGALSGGVEAGGGAEPLAAGAALLVLAGYAGLAWLVGAWTVARRDYSAGRDR